MTDQLIRSDHKNIDHGFTSPFMVEYLKPPPDCAVSEQRIAVDVELPGLADDGLMRVGKVEIYCKQMQRPGADRWMLLVNGFASSTRLWDYQVAHLLKSGYNLVLFDLLGQGHSAKPDGVKYTVASQVAVMETIVAATPLATKPFYLTGISAGGVIAQRYAVKHQEKLLALSLLATTPKVDGRLAFTQEIQRLYLANEKLSDAEKLSFCAYFLMDHIFSDAFFRKFKPAIYGVIANNIAGNTVGTYLGALSSIDDFDIIDDLPKLTVPTLIFTGLHDKLIETHFGVVLNRQIPRSQRYVLKGVYASHTFIMEMFETFNEVFVHALAGAHDLKGSKSPIYVENTHFQEFATDEAPDLESMAV